MANENLDSWQTKDRAKRVRKYGEEVVKIQEQLKKVDTKARALSSCINGLLCMLNAVDVQQLGGIESFLTAHSLRQVTEAIEKLKRNDLPALPANVGRQDSDDISPESGGGIVASS